ncbi:uncharacterized protein [Mycetomoellerius zeteki]|uniref:uncharacterized protein isoform X2 n=1 Tax=Mycetomoellerius zeteki TaxID=64791 RepID=UPI00084EBE84|nr:PREDICTED: uncharacterized protein LOC108725128 isoform X2 [Trachymyrmex zeteki]
MPSVYCVLCGNRDKSVSYFAFPKEENIRKQWLAFCGINEQVLNTVTKLCTNHFREEDIIKKPKRSYMKPNTVPFIHGKKGTRSLYLNSFNNKIDYKNKKDIATDRINIDYNVSVNDTSVTVTERIPQSSENVQLNCQTSSEAEARSRIGIIEIPGSTAKANTSLREYFSNFQTCTKAIQKPRYVGNITTQHLSTLRKVQRSLKIAKHTISRQQKKIKSLQQRRNRFIARITTLKCLIKHLKKKNLLTEAAAENLKLLLLLPL